ncbi:unnamed protein product, partial [Didymodactylos carnosus]
MPHGRYRCLSLKRTQFSQWLDNSKTTTERNYTTTTTNSYNHSIKRRQRKHQTNQTYIDHSRSITDIEKTVVGNKTANGPSDRNRMAKKNYDLLFKLLLIGDSGVGKTCILFRFSDDSFNASFISTIGIDFKIKTIELDGRKIKLQIWDTAGQERFHTITTSYYRGAMGIMLVYDVTQARSFENINKWLRNIDDHASDDVVKMLIGNKCDMEDKRCITKQRGELLAREHSIQFLETSAKNNINIEKSFYEMARLILKKTPGNTNNQPQSLPELNRPNQSNYMSIQPKVICISGGAQGIGRVMIHHFLSLSYHVICADIDENAGKELVNIYEDKKEQLTFVQTDVTKEESVKSLFDIVKEKFGYIDVLINNAGVFVNLTDKTDAISGIEKLSLDSWNYYISVNLTSVFLMAKYAIPLLRSNPHKVSLTHSMAISLSKDQIRVNCITPGWIDVTGSQKSTSNIKQIVLTTSDHEQHPAQRVGVGQDIAEMAAFLAEKDKSGFITGQNFIVDG